MKNKTFYITLFAYTAVICGAFAVEFPTTTTQQPFSKSGQIQNVQNYSSNPFWSPDAPYNQRMPVPVYVQGTDVNTSDCQRIVSSLISSYCSTRNNCLGLSLSDVRPTITVQLANLPNHNFVTPCSGYIDTEFESYVKQNAIAAPTGKSVEFPTATTPNSDLNQQEAKFENPYAPKLPQWNGEPWAEEMQERKKELENLQAQNSYGTNQVVKADFPNTFADLSFTERQEILKQGYEPFKESSAYAGLNIKETLTQNSLSQTNTNISNSKENNCTNLAGPLNTLKSDLNILISCQKAKKKFSDCITSLENNYFPNSFEAATTDDTQKQSYTVETKGENETFGNLAKSWSVSYLISSSLIASPLIAQSLLVSLFIADSDCVMDPVTNKKTCCNAPNETGDRYVNIGGYMFCGEEIRDAQGNVSEIKPVYGYVRQCLQGNKKRSTTPAPWYSAPFKNDFWDDNCIQRFCEGEVAPTQEIYAILEWEHDDNNICWRWNCPSDKYIKVGNNCIKYDNPDGTNLINGNEYDYLIKLINNEINKIEKNCPELIKQ